LEVAGVPSKTWRSRFARYKAGKKSAWVIKIKSLIKDGPVFGKWEKNPSRGLQKKKTWVVKKDGKEPGSPRFDGDRVVKKKGRSGKEGGGGKRREVNKLWMKRGFAKVWEKKDRVFNERALRRGIWGIGWG